MSQAVKALRGGFWLVGLAIVVRVLHLGKGAVLARLFAPDAFGLLATLLLVQGLFLTLVQAGLQNYVVAAEDEERAMAGAFRYALLGSGLASIAMLAAAPVTSEFGYGELGAGLAVLTLANFAVPFSLASASMDREYRFGRAKVPELVDVVLATAIAAVLRDALGGACALVVGHVSGVWARAGLIWVFAPRRPRWELGRGQLAVAARFCGPLALAAIAGYVADAADDWFVRSFWGEEALGRYTLAFWLPGFVLAFVSLTSRVLLPYLREHRQDRQRLARTFAETNHMVAIVSAPVGVAMAVFAEPVIISLYGEPWRAAAPILRLFAFSFVLRGTTGFNWSLLAILDGNTRYLSYVSWATMVFAVVVGGPLIAWLGPEGGGWYNIIQLGVMGPIVRFPIILQATGSLRYLLSVWRPLGVAAVLGLIVSRLPMPSTTIELIGAVVAYVAVYTACLLAIDSRTRTLLRRFRRLALEPAA